MITSIIGAFGVLAPIASDLKAWQTAFDPSLAWWLPRANAIIWDSITISGALGVLASGVREMVLAYFIRKEYEEDIAAIRSESNAVVEEIKQQNQRQQEQITLLLKRLDGQQNGSEPDAHAEPA